MWVLRGGGVDGLGRMLVAWGVEREAYILSTR